MAPRFTAKMMRDALDRFILDNGEECPVYYQLFSHHDVVDYDEDNDIHYNRELADDVINSLHDEDHITEYIFDTIGDVIRYKLAHKSN